MRLTQSNAPPTPAMMRHQGTLYAAACLLDLSVAYPGVMFSMLAERLNVSANRRIVATRVARALLAECIDVGTSREARIEAARRARERARAQPKSYETERTPHVREKKLYGVARAMNAIEARWKDHVIAAQRTERYRNNQPAPRFASLPYLEPRRDRRDAWKRPRGAGGRFRKVKK